MTFDRAFAGAFRPHRFSAVPEVCGASFRPAHAGRIAVAFQVVFVLYCVWSLGEEWNVTVVDRESWPRKDRYEFFAGLAWPFWSVTFPVDVTGLHRWCRRRGVSLYYAMVHAVTQAMDGVEAFHYKDREGSIIRHDTLVPSFTDLRPGSEDFYIVTMEAGADMEAFCRKARAASRTQKEFLPQGLWPEDQLIYLTSLPWLPITALSNERDLTPWDSIPRASWGKYMPDGDGREMLSLSLELNHRLLDGIHVGQFYEKLNGILEAL